MATMFENTQCAWCNKLMEPLRTRQSGVWQCFYCMGKVVICDAELSAKYIEPEHEDDSED